MRWLTAPALLHHPSYARHASGTPTTGPSMTVRLVLALTAAVAVPADELDEDEPFELDLPFPTLEAAAKAGNSGAVMDLLQLGQSSRTPDFDVHYPNPDGFTPLYWSSWSGCSDCVEMMLQAGADVNQNGYDGASPLMAAASSNFSDVCSQLISAGADLHARRKTAHGEYTALDIASERQYYEVIAVLQAALNKEAEEKREKRENGRKGQGKLNGSKKSKKGTKKGKSQKRKSDNG